MKTLLKEGLVYDSEKRQFIKSDILIENEKILKVDIDIDERNVEKIACKGKHIMPGGIDPHTHLDHDLGGGLVTVDNFESGTKAALYGGTTCIIDHVSYGNSNNTLEQIIIDYHEKAKNSYTDYSFHGVAFKNSQSTIDELKSIKELDISSIKIYTVYGEKLEDKWILEVLKVAKEKDITVCVHCENEDIINYSEELVGNELIDFPNSRPVEAEAEMVERLIYYSKITGFPKLYFVHVSSKQGMEHIIKAKQNGHKNLFAETCTQYLMFTDSKYQEDNGGLYVCSPPLRKRIDVEYLWGAIKDGYIDVIATDHCSFRLEDKLNIKNYKSIAGGVPGIEERVLVVLSEALKRNIPIEKVIDKMMLNPAKIFKLTKKGDLKEGKDADMLIIEEIKNYHKEIHGSSDYSLYKDYELNFKIDKVFLRGSLIIDKGNLIEKKTLGKFVKKCN